MNFFTKNLGRAQRVTVRSWRLALAYVGLEDLKQRADSLLDRPADLVSLIFHFSGDILQPVQLEEELAGLAQEVRKLYPLRVLEIGTHKGGTLFLWTRLARRDGTIVSIDLPGGKFGGGYGQFRAAIYRRFSSKGQTLHLLRCNSHDRSTFEKARQLFGDAPIDLLFIDGDHTYEGVKADWEMYSPLVRPGGMIVFHDIGKNYDDTEVKKLWDSIKPNFNCREYAIDRQGYYGVGIVFV
jgi:predicted O-methyltransferase YrrM